RGARRRPAHNRSPPRCTTALQRGAHSPDHTEGSAQMDAIEALSVWPVAQQLAREQRRRRYLPESNAHPGKMLPALAREAIRRYTRPGELVLDPMCGIGTTLVEAAHLGRQAIGVELEPRWAALAAANIRHAET